MSQPADDAWEDQLVQLLTAADAALAAGQTVITPAPANLAEPVRQRLERAQRCLNQLARAWPAALPVPRQIGRFTIEREIGRGGFGIVYLAHDPVLRRPVAVKVPRVEISLASELLDRFRREAQLAAALDHPHIVPAHEAGNDGGVWYLVSAYCPGPNLAAWLKERPRPPFPIAAAMIRDLARAIQHAHERGIIHRDLKPSNILLSTERAADAMGYGYTAKIADFGLARMVEDANELTHSRVMLGTPSYMSPEQARGRSKEIGPPSDIYNLGAILYELLTGRPPFANDTVLETLDQVRATEPARPRERRPDVPRDLETICLTCLRKEPGQRYASAQELADDLQRCLDGQAIRARLPGVAARVNAWSRRPERMRDAGALAILFSGLYSLYALAMLALVFVGFHSVTDRADSVKFVAGAFVFCYIPLTFLGWNAMARRGWAIYGGTLFAVALFAFIVLQELLTPLDDGLNRKPLDALAFAVLTNLVVALLLLSHLVALRAYFANRKAT